MQLSCWIDRISPYYNKDFMVKLNGMLDTASSEGKEMLLFGDFNCCFMSSHRNDTDCKQLKSLFRSLNIKQLINQPTRITKTLKSLIDLVAVNCAQSVCVGSSFYAFKWTLTGFLCLRIKLEKSTLSSQDLQKLCILMLTPFEKTWKVLTAHRRKWWRSQIILEDDEENPAGEKKLHLQTFK